MRERDSPGVFSCLRNQNNQCLFVMLLAMNYKQWLTLAAMIEKAEASEANACGC